ncbi:MAG: hypothetical protein LHW45_03630 [Candidatus Cloacimonetes bacterium]|jgi:hypothetical protein|nr:hypothetical protein [Candidatus Cloacimonadota bacterium]MDY0366707.1 hypothetical protein [Candidatus Syntrophosphaera sp.]
MWSPLPEVKENVSIPALSVNAGLPCHPGRTRPEGEEVQGDETQPDIDSQPDFGQNHLPSGANWHVSEQKT